MSTKIQEPFDYTKWQEDLFEDISYEELGEIAMEYYEATFL